MKLIPYKKKIILGFLFFIYFCIPAFYSPSETLALVCSSPKKGAATANWSHETKTPLGMNHFYAYHPTSGRCDTTPMLKENHVSLLMAQPNPNICNLPVPNCEHNDQYQCCPAKQIKDSSEWRQNCSERYWLIYNEPGNPIWDLTYNACQTR